MSSRAYPSVRRDPTKESKKRGPNCPIREIPEASDTGRDRKMVCRICHLVMKDLEPMVVQGEFYHHDGIGDKPRVKACPNVNKIYRSNDPQVEPFLKKSRRRALKRMNIRP